MECIIEVGAHTATDTRRLAEKYKGVTFYCFEPTNWLFHRYVEPFARNRPNVHVVQCAISLENGETDFYNSTEDGCNSLYPFTENIAETWNKTLDEKLGDRHQREKGCYPNARARHFSHWDKERVETIRMDTFLHNQNFSLDGVIKYLHCDAQGSDLNVLKSFGEYINCLQAGVIETSNKGSLNLYNNTENYTEDAIIWLSSKGFKISNIESNDPLNAETNVHFER